MMLVKDYKLFNLYQTIFIFPLTYIISEHCIQFISIQFILNVFILDRHGTILISKVEISHKYPSAHRKYTPLEYLHTF